MKKRFASLGILSITALLTACGGFTLSPIEPFPSEQSSISSSSSNAFSSEPLVSSEEEKVSSKEEISSITTPQFDFTYTFPIADEYENFNDPSTNRDWRVRFEGARTFEDEFTVYAMEYDEKTAQYYSKAVKTLYRDHSYTYYEDVAMYYMVFYTWPKNYFTSKSDALDFGTEGRVVSTYTYGSYSGSYSYTQSFGEWNNKTSSSKYHELDIDLDGTYNTGRSISRGKGRLVVVESGLADYGAEPVVFFTSNHYESFYEFYNYYGGWGEEMKGTSQSTCPPRKTPKTINSWINL